MSVSVALGTLQAISVRLDGAATALGDTAAGSPTGVDAGEMTPVAVGIAALVVEGAAVIAAGLAQASAEVDTSVATYLAADGRAADSLGGR